jgi:hypothetical protein
MICNINLAPTLDIPLQRRARAVCVYEKNNNKKFRGLHTLPLRAGSAVKGFILFFRVRGATVVSLFLLITNSKMWYSTQYANTPSLTADQPISTRALNLKSAGRTSSYKNNTSFSFVAFSCIMNSAAASLSLISLRLERVTRLIERKRKKDASRGGRPLVVARVNGTRTST